MNWSVVILAAGVGKRMRSSIPKSLHQVAGKPMLTHVIDAVRKSSDGEVTVVVRPDQIESPDFRSAVGKGTKLVGQENQLGTADALSAASELALGSDRVLVLYADTPLIEPETVANLIQASESAEVAIAFVTADPPPVGGLGRIVRDSNGTVARIVEEADADGSTLAITEVNSGWYAFSGEFLRKNLANIQPAPNGELYLTDLIEVATAASAAAVVQTMGTHARSRGQTDLDLQSALASSTQYFWRARGRNDGQGKTHLVPGRSTIVVDPSPWTTWYDFLTPAVATAAYDCCPPPNRLSVVQQVATETGYPDSGMDVTDFTQRVAEKLHAEDQHWGRRINITGPLGKDTVAYKASDGQPYSIDIVMGATGANPQIHWDEHGFIGGTWVAP